MDWLLIAIMVQLWLLIVITAGNRPHREISREPEAVPSWDMRMMLEGRVFTVDAERLGVLYVPAGTVAIFERVVDVLTDWPRDFSGLTRVTPQNLRTDSPRASYCEVGLGEVKAPRRARAVMVIGPNAVAWDYGPLVWTELDSAVVDPQYLSYVSALAR